MSQSNPEQRNPEDFWAQELHNAQPEPSPDFLKRLDQKIITHAHQMQTKGNPMNLVRPSFSENGYHADSPPIYMSRPRRMPHLRWVAVASVVALILMGVFLTMSPNPQPLPTASVGQTDSAPVGQQTEDCMVVPETGWVVHVVGEDETLAEIAGYYGIDESHLAETNCLVSDEPLKTNSLVYLPLATTQIVFANQRIPAGSAVTEEMLSYTLWHHEDPLANTYTNADDLVNGYAVVDIPAGKIIESGYVVNDILVYDGQTYQANEDEVVMNVPLSVEWLADRQSTSILYFNLWGNNCQVAYSSSYSPAPFGFGQDMQICLDFTMDDPLAFQPPMLNTGQISAHYLYQDEEQLIVSLPIVSAINLQEFVASDRQIQILSDTMPSQVNHVAISVPFSVEQMSELAGTDTWNMGDQVQLSVVIEDCNGIPIEISEQMDCRDNRTHFIQATVVSVNGSPFHPGDEMAGIATFSMQPRDAVFLTWVIEAKIPIEYQKIVEQ